MKTVAEKIDEKLVELQISILLLINPLINPTSGIKTELDNIIVKNRIQIMELMEHGE